MSELAIVGSCVTLITLIMEHFVKKLESSSCSWSPRDLVKNMTKVNIDPAKSSTCEYYNSNKENSYPLNLDSDIRGRALVFVMTENRPGWQYEVWDLYKTCNSVNIKPSFVYDADSKKLQSELKYFVTHEDNRLIDCCIVAFLGHGSKKPTNFLDSSFRLKDRNINIGAFCQFVFSSKKSSLKEKPKLFIVEACRKEKKDGREIRNEPIQKLPSWKHYQIVFSCQPGETSHRSRFTKYFAQKIYELACDNQWDNILKNIVKCFMREHSDQMPQPVGIFPFDFNIFPGITQNMLAGPDNDNKDKSDCLTKDTFNQASNSPVTSELASSLTSEINPGTDITNSTTLHDKDEKSKTKVKLILVITETSPNTDDNKNDAQIKMFQKLSDNATQALLSMHLSEELETEVEITGLEIGSVVIYITLQDEEALERLLFMSDTGLLSSLAQTYLVTPEFVDTCTANKVKISVILDTENIEDLPAVHEEIPCKFPVCGNGVIISCPSPSDKDSPALWSKDGQQLESKDRLKFTHDGASCQLEILNTVATDKGRYKCEYMGLDKRQHITECSVVVFIKLQPPLNIQVIKTSYNSADIHWSKANNPCNLQSSSYYKVNYWLQSNVKETFSKRTNDNELTIDGLIPGEIYKLTVTCEPDSDTDPLYIESDPVPSGSYTFYTKPNPPVVTSIQKITPNQLEFRWQKPKKNMKFNISVALSRTGNTGYSGPYLPEPAVTVSDDSCTARVKNIFPFMIYTYKYRFMFGDQKSEEIKIWELCFAPCSMQIKEKTETTVTVGWEWVRSNYDVFVTGYTIECEAQGSGQKVSQGIRHDVTACKIQNLRPDSEYEIRLIPLDCKSRPLPMKNGRSLKVSRLLKPADLEVTQGVHAVDITWKPEEKKTEYIVRYWDYDEDYYKHLQSPTDRDLKFVFDEAQLYIPDVIKDSEFGEIRENLQCILIPSFSFSVTLYHLIPGFKYGISVAAFDGNQESDECHYIKGGKYEAVQIK